MKRVRFTYTAHFTPEAWLNDQAVAIDAEGEDEWDVTASVNAHPEYWSELVADTPEGWLEFSGVLDRHDALKDDPNAPEWVREHHGPFTIRVTRQVAA